MVERTSVIQVALPPLQVDSTDQTQRQVIGRDLMALIFRGLETCVYRKLKPGDSDGEARRGSGMNE
jgi:hypothetical protein